MSDTRYYSRKGEPMGFREWATAIEGKPFEEVKRVAETTLPDGHWVSTVWLGIDHSFGSGPPLIFETMVFENRQNMNDLDCDRYSTEDEARAGHERMVLKWGKAAGDGAMSLLRCFSQ